MKTRTKIGILLALLTAFVAAIALLCTFVSPNKTVLAEEPSTEQSTVLDGYIVSTDVNK